MPDSPACNLVWLRRDLRLSDHTALAHALAAEGKVQPVFIFDTDILAAFPGPYDRRVGFIAETLCLLDRKLRMTGGQLLVLHGSAKELIPRLAEALQVTGVYAAEDYEPQTMIRDKEVAAALEGKARVRFVKDQVIFNPREILREGGEAYKVYTPYANAWRKRFTPDCCHPHTYVYTERWMSKPVLPADMKQVNLSGGAQAVLEQIGYVYKPDPLWQPRDVSGWLTGFAAKKATGYADTRDFPAQDSTSRLSPYLRFGLVSIRECVQMALEIRAETWLNELIWREFYAMILYHFPESVTENWNPKYRGKLDWVRNADWLAKWKEGKTGYPFVDAGMRQLLEEGWMHNRLRMVTASFLTKHLRTDWREGEQHFAQYLMDYDMASNVGGWQWAASTGTDAQPYFRVFNPVMQGEKFDAEGTYIRRYVPELKDADKRYIHAPWKAGLLCSYYPPMVEHGQAREAAIAMFKGD
ncbi:MAG TPA: deoxyribodipyrimidine photo-lyase [Rickettsiales bacterium]|nr:deoxyribodipyrimidine photo-lyase [Rickettsiales bacterium]